MKYLVLLLLTFLTVPFFALVAVATGATSSKHVAAGSGRGGRLRMLPLQGRQERAVCSAEGACRSKVVTCPAECPERRHRSKSQEMACFVDCADACVATCKTLIHGHKPRASNATQPYQTWCNKTKNEIMCSSMARSDPREDLKLTPHGLIVILVSAAQAKAKETRHFINESLMNQTVDADSDNSREVLNGCMLAYNLGWVKSTLSVDIQQVIDQQRCCDLNDALRSMVSEVTYDCEWNLPSPRSPTLSQMYESVELLASIVDSARQILSLIGCGEF